MAGRASAFAVLGLQPGADEAAIEQAYKRLIKQHHPDREGGDSIRAAEINRAYRELRQGTSEIDPLEFNEHGAPRRRPRWPVAALVAGLAVFTFLHRLALPVDVGHDRGFDRRKFLRAGVGVVAGSGVAAVVGQVAGTSSNAEESRSAVGPLVP